MVSRIAAIVMCILLASCASVKQERENESVVTYSLGLGLYTYAHQRLDVPESTETVSLIFPTIPGSIYGIPSNDLLQVVSATPEQKFILPLPEDVSEKAKVFSQKGFAISPKDTKVLRLGTFHLYEKYHGSWGGGGFVDKATGDFLTLVYFSKPSYLSGKSYIRGEEYLVDVSIPEKGWHWLVTNSPERNKNHTTLYKGDLSSVEFAAYIEDVVSI